MNRCEICGFKLGIDSRHSGLRHSDLSPFLFGAPFCCGALRGSVASVRDPSIAGAVFGPAPTFLLHRSDLRVGKAKKQCRIDFQPVSQRSIGFQRVSCTDRSTALSHFLVVFTGSAAVISRYRLEAYATLLLGLASLSCTTKLR